MAGKNKNIKMPRISHGNGKLVRQIARRFGGQMCYVP